MKNKIATFLWGLCLLWGLCGCSLQGTQENPALTENQQDETEKEDPEKAEDGSSDQNEGLSLEDHGINKGNGPRVFVDVDGYGTDDKKLVYFLGSEKSGTFQVVDADTKETVYTGTMRASLSGNGTDMYLQKGDFSSLTEPGNYYIEASHIGRSYSFHIGESPYEQLCERLLEAMKEETEAATGEFLYRSQTLSWMLRYQEFYPETEGSLNPGATPELLTYAQKLGEQLAEDWEKKTGARTDPEAGAKLTNSEIAYYCAAMAQLYEALKEYDAGKANIFLKEAADAYEVLYKRRGTEFDETLLFYDAAVLYKATGQSKYHNLIKSYLKADSQRVLFAGGAQEEGILSDEAYVFGAVAYMSTLYKVDTALCGDLMDALMEGTERIVADCEANDYFCASTDRRNRVLSDRLYLVAVIEHVVVSKEYVDILQNGIHYINGSNESGNSFLTRRGVYDPENDEKYSDAALGGAYLFILGEILESEAAE